MASAPNEVTIVGNVTRDPELRFTNSGQAIAHFSIAYNTRRKNASGEWEDADPSYFNVTCWGQLAENVADSISKGTRVFVNGRLEQRSYETKDGEKRQSVDIIAEEVGPSLRWATVEVKKNERRDDDRGGRSSGGGGRSSGSGREGTQRGYDPDEEPF